LFKKNKNTHTQQKIPHFSNNIIVALQHSYSVCILITFIVSRPDYIMSTKTSADMHVDRSSTRRHAPPGGKSTFSFGSYDDKAKAPVAAAAPEVVVEEGEHIAYLSIKF
jgi:hypothetical protein